MRADNSAGWQMASGRRVCHAQAISRQRLGDRCQRRPQEQTPNAPRLGQHDHDEHDPERVVASAIESPRLDEVLEDRQHQQHIKRGRQQHRPNHPIAVQEHRGER